MCVCVYVCVCVKYYSKKISIQTFTYCERLIFEDSNIISLFHLYIFSIVKCYIKITFNDLK